MKGRLCLWILFFFCEGVWAIDLSLSIDQNPSTFEPGSSQSNAYEVTISKPNGSADVTDITVTTDFDKIPAITPGGFVVSALSLRPVPSFSDGAACQCHFGSWLTGSLMTRVSL